tara:strand:+ start:187 stop:879 length:693 start_codon:yes stop_codon:yes gene_type:complete
MNASILLALITSLLYISGVSYIDSYLTEWGVESSLITSNTQEVLVQGAGIWFVGGIYIVIPSVFIGVFLFFQLYMVSELSRMPYIRNIASKIYKAFKPRKKEQLDPPFIIQLVTKWTLQFLFLFIFLSIFLLFFYRLLDFSSSQASERAKKEYNELSTGKPSGQRIFGRQKILTVNGVQKEGYILASSNSLVVLYLPPTQSANEQVIVIPVDSISEIRTHKVATNRVRLD